jgi:hypothetical protein
MKVKKHIAISDSGVVYNGSTGDSFSINPIGIDILNQIKNQQSEQAIKKSLLEKYDVTEERIEGDLYDFIVHLRQLNILEKDE